MLIGKRAGYPKSQVLGNRCHSLHQQEWVIDRNLDPAVNRRICAALIYVVWAENIGKKQTVEFAALQQASQVSPMIKVDISIRAISWVTPQSRRLVTDTIHRK